jgi:hypothetical protein
VPRSFKGKAWCHAMRRARFESKFPYRKKAARANPNVSPGCATALLNGSDCRCDYNYGVGI